jgi:ankyrin repeat protein
MDQHAVMSLAQNLRDSIERGDLDTLRVLLDTDPMLVYARFPDANDQRMTALQIAAGKGRLDICRLLVERGAEVYTNPANTYPPVMQASWGGHQAVVDYFLHEIPDQADGTNRLGVTINLAARKGWAEIVRRHIQADPLSVHQRGWIGDTALHWPAHNGNTEIVGMLLDAGADIEADEINCYGGKPLHWASEHSPATVELLLARGADVDSLNRKTDSAFFGMTPLIMNATQKDDCAEVTRLLLDAGADVAAIDAQGKTALAHAQERGLVRIAEVLQGHGAKE